MTHYSHYSTLDDDGRDRLTLVLKIASGNLNLVPSAVNQALKGVSEPPRRIYLRNELTRRATRHINDKMKSRARGKKSTSKMAFVITPAMRLDAWLHEQSLCRGIPADDR
ncbi:MAG: hypothetical protein WAW13_01155 [Minisyncoccia bacterium]